MDVYVVDILDISCAISMNNNNNKKLRCFYKDGILSFFYVMWISKLKHINLTKKLFFIFFYWDNLKIWLLYMGFNFT